MLVVHTRKAQLSIFLVLISVLVLSLVLWLLSKPQSPQTTPPPIQEHQTTRSLTQFVEQCMQELARPAIQHVAARGGNKDYPLYTKKYDAITYSSGCVYAPGKGCVTTLPTREDMQLSISELIANQLPYCLNLTPYYNQGTHLTFSTQNITTTIGTDKVTLTLHWPTTLHHPTTKHTQTTFTTTLPSSIGRLHLLAVDLLNKHITRTPFHPSDWMLTHQASITILQTYPSYLYTLQDNDGTTFRFAALAKPTQDYLFTTHQDIPFPSCNYQGICYNNVEICKGIALPGTCPAQTSYPETTCENCNDCSTINKAHGTSWCVYEQLSGHGKDTVGSRHVKQSCINGKIHTQVCNDFREQLCVQQGSNATCRDNRWEDCAMQPTQTACEDTTQRDCLWQNWTVDTQRNPLPKCVPHVPPGLSFWRSDMRTVCQQQNRAGNCPQGETSCPNEWSAGDAVLCYNQGDCGDSQNFLGAIGRGGFENTDYIAHEKQTTPELLNVHNPPYPGYQTNLPLPLSVTTHPDFQSAPYQTDAAIDTFLQTWFSTASGWSTCTMFECDEGIPETPLYRHYRQWIPGATKCKPYVPPAQGDCTQCKSTFIPCSAYRCHSIGQNCVYNEDFLSGNGICQDARTLPIANLSIGIDLQSAAPYTLLGPWQFCAGNCYEGMVLSPSINSTFSYTVITNRPARCQLAILPPELGQATSLFNGYLPAILASNGTTHTFTIPSVNIRLMQHQITTFLNTTSTLQYASGFTNYFNQALNISQLLTNTTQQLITFLFSQAINNNHYLFTHCTDQSANAPSAHFVRITLDQQALLT